MSSSNLSSTSAKRRPSLPSASSEAILASADKPTRPSIVSALIKHGKHVVMGAGGCWWVGIPDAVKGVLQDEGGWVRKLLITALACHAFTIAIFLYLVLFLPYFRGYIPNYPKWQQSARLRVLVPVLTASIFLGWTSYVVSLSQAGKRSSLRALGDAVKGVGEGDLGFIDGQKGLGLLGAIAGVTALYTLTLGLLGFIQAPPNTPVRKKEL